MYHILYIYIFSVSGNRAGFGAFTSNVIVRDMHRLAALLLASTAVALSLASTNASTLPPLAQHVVSVPAQVALPANCYEGSYRNGNQGVARWRAGCPGFSLCVPCVSMYLIVLDVAAAAIAHLCVRCSMPGCWLTVVTLASSRACPAHPPPISHTCDTTARLVSACTCGT